MPRYVFFINNENVTSAVSNSVYAEQLASLSGYEKIDFETEAKDKQDAELKLKAHFGENTKAVKEFGGDITFSSVIEAFLR
jgi:hypothetical protein